MKLNRELHLQFSIQVQSMVVLGHTTSPELDGDLREAYFNETIEKLKNESTLKVAEPSNELPTALVSGFQSIAAFLLNQEDSESLFELPSIKDNLQLEDVKLVMWNYLFALFNVPEEISNWKLANVFALLSHIPPPLKTQRQFFCSFTGAGRVIVKKLFKFALVQEVYSNVWLRLTKIKLPKSVHKKVLMFIPDHVMPSLVQPVLMTDFLIYSFQLGGVFGVLGLNGLFILMSKHNLDYPDFYNNLYSLLQPNLFSVKYRSRFFKLLDLFLSSTHLPAYLVAAFVKRLCRLCLISPADVCLTILCLVQNLIIRHPAIEALINRTSDNDQDATSVDCYDVSESDTAKSNAINSSLWEVKTLERHYVPEIANKARLFSKSLGSIEDEFVQSSSDEIYSMLSETNNESSMSSNTVKTNNDRFLHSSIINLN